MDKRPKRFKEIDNPYTLEFIEEKNTNKPIIELLGIKLYKDDILILLLIYFLYMEKNNDFILYILLFSLILS